MTAIAELERVARGVIPPAGATGWRISVDDLVWQERRTVYAVVPIIGGRLDGRPVFRGDQADCRRFYGLLAGEAPTSRERAQAEHAGSTAPVDLAVPGPAPEAPQPPTPAVVGGAAARPTVDPRAAASEPGTCVQCGGPLPPAGHGQRRLTCSGCRTARSRELRLAAKP